MINQKIIFLVTKIQVPEYFSEKKHFFEKKILSLKIETNKKLVHAET
jgi:hypothetical protein